MNVCVLRLSLKKPDIILASLATTATIVADSWSIVFEDKEIASAFSLMI